jgi:hypothetical protein
MQTSDLARLGILALCFLGVVYVAVRSKGAQSDAKGARASAEEAATTRQAVEDFVRGVAPVTRPQSDHRLPTLYQVAASHYISGNEILWAYLYYYLVAATFLVVAWSTVFAGQKPEQAGVRDLVLGTLAFGGVVLSWIWWRLLVRANTYRLPLREAASSAEKALRDALDPKGTFLRVEEHGKSLGWDFGSTGFVINVVPLFLGFVFVVLFLVVVWPYVCGCTV